MNAKGMTIRDIQTHVQEIYGANLSPALIANITEKVMESVAEWQARPLQADTVY
jgi:transposase-like protein